MSKNTPRILLVSNFNSLSFRLAMELLDEDLSLIIDNSNKKIWTDRLEDKSKLQEILFLNTKFPITHEKIGYVISLNFIDGLKENKKYLQKEIDNINLSIKIAKDHSAKSLFIFPFCQSKTNNKIILKYVNEILINKNIYAGILYIGERTAEKNYNQEKNIYSLLKQAISSRAITIYKNSKYFYPVGDNLLVKEIIKNLFSLKAFGKEMVIISKALDVTDVIKRIQKVIPEIRIKYKDGEWSEFYPVVSERTIINTNIDNFIRKEVDSIKKDTAHKIKIVNIKRLFFKSSKKKNLNKFVSLKKLLSIVVVLFFISPIFMVGTSFINLFFVDKNDLPYKYMINRQLLKVSLVTSRFAKAQSGLFMSVPFFDYLYREVNIQSFLLEKISEIEIDKNVLSNDLLDLSLKVTGKDEYSVNDYSEKISLEIKSLYRDIDFLEGETRFSTAFTKKVTSALSDTDDSLKYKNNLLLMGKIIRELPDVLGENSPKRYMIMFQDDSVIRSTGGKIITLALVTFSKGKISEVKIIDSKYADNQLKGNVEPPEPLRKYLQMNQWSLEESNWYIDFPISATKAEWFLDKELNVSLDGAIGVNFKLIKNSLKSIFGSINITRLNKTVTYENFDEIFNIALEKELSGSLERTYYIDLSKEILTKYFTSSKENRIKMVKILLSALKTKDIQMFFHNINLERTLSDLNWSGEVITPVCVGNCYSDLLGVIETNFNEGANSGDLKREADLTISFEEGVIKKDLVIYAQFPSGKPENEKEYTEYLRVLVPAEDGFSPVEVRTGDKIETEEPEIYGLYGYKEAGVLVSFNEGETKAIRFTWEGPAKISYVQPGSYKLKWIKQGGIDDFPIKITVRNLNKQNLKINSIFNLTDTGEFVYNTSLSEDFNSDINWFLK